MSTNLDKIISAKQDNPRTLMSSNFRGISLCGALWYSTVCVTTVPLLLGCGPVLKIQDRLLAKEYKKLPLAGHVFGSSIRDPDRQRV